MRDRRAILARRAALLQATLVVAGLGCPPQPAPETRPVVNGEEPAPVPEPSASMEEPAPKVESPPKVEAPPGANDALKKRYAELSAQAAEDARHLDDVDKMVPETCSIMDSACEAEWSKLALGMFELDYSYVFVGVPCPDASEETKVYGKSVQLLRAWHEKRRAQIIERIDARLNAPGAVEQWKRLQDKARQANPRPCLSFACWE